MSSAHFLDQYSLLSTVFILLFLFTTKLRNVSDPLEIVYSKYSQWRSQDLVLGGGGGNMRGSEATEPERAERARGGGGG